jgi:hypothetical protein
MAVIVCPWCQSEIPLEEGQEPDRYCPVCDNELGGYRTVTFDVGGDDEEESEPEDAAEADEADWEEDRELREKNETLLLYEETVEKLLDDQEIVPECPQCREYMLEAGETIVGADSFRSRSPERLGGPLLTPPFALTLYVCPSCFAVQYSLAEGGRARLAQKLAEAAGEQR